MSSKLIQFFLLMHYVRSTKKDDVISYDSVACKFQSSDKSLGQFLFSVPFHYFIPRIDDWLLKIVLLKRSLNNCFCFLCDNLSLDVIFLYRNSFEWIHVICAWWVPEVKIEDIDNVEKMTVDKIPVSPFFSSYIYRLNIRY